MGFTGKPGLKLIATILNVNEPFAFGCVFLAFRRSAVLAILFLSFASGCFLVASDLGEFQSYLPRFYCSRFIPCIPRRFGSVSTKLSSATGRCRVLKSSELPFLGILGVIRASAFHVGQVGGEQGKNVDHHGWFH